MSPQRSVTSRLRGVLTFWYLIRRLFLHVQIGAQRRSSLMNNNCEYRFLTTRYSQLCVWEIVCLTLSPKYNRDVFLKIFDPVLNLYSLRRYHNIGIWIPSINPKLWSDLYKRKTSFIIYTSQKGYKFYSDLSKITAYIAITCKLWW